jgi:hypothetical protein
LNFSDVIVLEVLESKGYKSPSMVRTTRHCRWYEVRKGADLYNVEAYDSVLCGSEGLEKYLKSLKSLPQYSFLRRPCDIVSEREITLIIRPHLEGEPLYALFLRPGSLPEQEACEVIKSFEKIHDHLLKSPLENFSPLAVLFFLTYGEKKGVVLDGLRCGPWIGYFEQISVIYNYLNPDLNWNGQVNYFRNCIIQKLFLGKPKLVENDLPEDFSASRAVKELVAGAIEDPENYNVKLSVLEKKYKPKPKRGLLELLAIIMLISLPLIAFFIRQMQTGTFWQGASIAQEEVDEGFGVDEVFSFDPEADKAIEIGHSFLQKVRQIEQMMTSGNFLKAFKEISYLSDLNLRPAEKAALAVLKTEYPLKKEIDFDLAVLRSQGYLTKQKFILASIIMKDIEKRYGNGPKAKQAAAMSERIMELKSTFEFDEKRKLERMVKSREKDRLLLTKIARLQSEVQKEPVLGLPALNKSLELAGLELVSNPSKYLLNCYVLMNDAETELYRQLLQKRSSEEKDKLGKTFSSMVGALSTVEVYNIKKSGVEYRDTAGGGNYKFANIPPATMYQIFKKSSPIDAKIQSYYLYLYCVKYELEKQAKSENKNINSGELLRKADSLRDMKQARKDLFEGDN